MEIYSFLGNMYDVDAYKIIYNTVSFDSTPTTASGLFCVPKNVFCQFPIISYQHGTMTKKSDAPVPENNPRKFTPREDKPQKPLVERKKKDAFIER